jgi:hypothetical protein
MKIPRDRDWPATIALAVMLALIVMLAMMDPSCRRSPDVGAHSMRIR